MAQAASKTCEICLSGPGHNYCEHCDQLFCDGCKISHLRTKMSKKHTFLSGPNINPEVKLYCKEHDENFIYYCMECNIPICKICAIKNHKSHDLAEIKESTEGIKAEVKKVIDMKMRNLQSKIADIDQGSNQYQADVNSVIHAIREEGRHLKELIDKKIESLVKSMKEKETKNLQTLQSIDNDIKTALNKAEEQQKIYQDTQGIKDTTKLIQKLKQINSQIDLIDEKPIPDMPFVKYAKKKVPSSEIEKLFGDLTFELNEMMGNHLENNEPAIRDLSDPDRPLSLVEKFSNVFDNEWTDTIEEIEQVTGNQRTATKILLTVVIDTYSECFDLRHKGNCVQELNNSSATVQQKVNEIADEYKIQLKKMKINQLQSLKQGILQKLAKGVDGKVLSCLSQSKKQYFEKCLELCWIMVCHSPPIHLDWEYKGHPFDLQILRPFTEAGDVVDYIIWPVMFLHKDGPLLCKGVAQGRSSSHQHKQGRSRSQKFYQGRGSSQHTEF